MPELAGGSQKARTELALGSPWGQVVWQGASIFALAVLVSLGVNFLRSDRLPLIADWSMKAQVNALPGTGDLAITMEDAQILFFDQQTIFLDARSEDVFETGHIEGARNLPFEDFDKYYPIVMSEIPRDAMIITYCDGETCGLSKELAFALIAKGYDNVRVLLDGWRQWQELNLPMEP